MAIEVFNRYEKKFLLNQKMYQNIEEKLKEHMDLDAYNKKKAYYTICNLYYDTSDSSIIRHSLSKPKYKEKLRLRSYDIPSQEDKVFLEIKKKYYGRVNKRRTLINLGDAYNFIHLKELFHIKDYMNQQVLKEIEYILWTKELEPKVFIAYDRKAYFGVDNKDLRITFDKNIRTRRYDLALEKGDYGEPLLDDNTWVMEVKIQNSVPVWLTKILSEEKVFRSSFSKYGKEYQNRIKNMKELKGEDDLCLNPSLTQQHKMLQYQ
ncbi:VTC domain-containing protein [Natranaerovirga hydrolytica]|uniref:VTC domain-containing protein n=1 Tax=Natranaerovirga hydrolytica TaxID=680378 RepID=A0A4R1MFS0_9FIRM|nr:polyphosphate polymerase domain-containing protein [Natranaerovirga hydrolytica]TCK90592.1 VTC domain-containing protein [Natranaerovirga hydrolytica]